MLKQRQPPVFAYLNTGLLVVKVQRAENQIKVLCDFHRSHSNCWIRTQITRCTTWFMIHKRPCQHQLQNLRPNAALPTLSIFSRNADFQQNSTFPLLQTQNVRFPSPPFPFLPLSLCSYQKDKRVQPGIFKNGNLVSIHVMSLITPSLFLLFFLYLQRAH